VAGGLVFEHFTAESAWYVPGASFYMSAALAGVGAVVAWRAVRPGRHLRHGEHSVGVREGGV
jgi:hypothetical protein